MTKQTFFAIAKPKTKSENQSLNLNGLNLIISLKAKLKPLLCNKIKN